MRRAFTRVAGEIAQGPHLATTVGRSRASRIIPGTSHAADDARASDTAAKDVNGRNGGITNWSA
jgi:hypothetical protein